MKTFLKAVPWQTWLVMVGYVIYSNFFAPQKWVENDLWLIGGIAIFWISFFSFRALNVRKRL